MFLFNCINGVVVADLLYFLPFLYTAGSRYKRRLLMVRTILHRAPVFLSSLLPSLQLYFIGITF